MLVTSHLFFSFSGLMLKRGSTSSSESLQESWWSQQTVSHGGTPSQGVRAGFLPRPHFDAHWNTLGILKVFFGVSGSRATGVGGLFTSDWGFCHTFSLLVLLVLNILVQTECAEGLSRLFFKKKMRKKKKPYIAIMLNLWKIALWIKHLAVCGLFGFELWTFVHNPT